MEERTHAMSTRATWCSLGHGSLWAAPFDEERLEVLGEPIAVVTGVATEPEGTAHFFRLRERYPRIRSR